MEQPAGENTVVCCHHWKYAVPDSNQQLLSPPRFGLGNKPVFRDAAAATPPQQPEKRPWSGAPLRGLRIFERDPHPGLATGARNAVSALRLDCFSHLWLVANCLSLAASCYYC